jgi:hypothetical protein
VAAKTTQWVLDKDKNFEKPFDPDNFLCLRLAGGNTRRREQLKFRQKHPERPSGNVSSLLLPSKSHALFANFASRSIVASETTAPFVDSASLNTAASTITTQSFPTAAKSVLEDIKIQSGRSKTIYAPSGRGGTVAPSRVPGVPKAPSGSLTFACPYCFIELKVDAMSDRQLWK